MQTARVEAERKMINVFKEDFRTRMEFFSLLGIPRGERISSV